MGKELTHEEVIENIVETVMILDAQDYYADVLQIWAKYIGMVFEEEKRKDGQRSRIMDALSEQREKIQTQAAGLSKDEPNYYFAAQVLAIDVIRPVVAQSFDFSTYSGAKRCAYIQKAISEEIACTLEKLAPVRHIMEEFRNA